MISEAYPPYRGVSGSGNSDAHPDAYPVDNPPHVIPLARNYILVIYMIAGTRCEHPTVPSFNAKKWSFRSRNNPDLPCVEGGGPDRDRTGDLRRVKPTFKPSTRAF